MRGRLARFALLGSVACGLLSVSHLLGLASAPRAEASVVCMPFVSLEHSWSPDGSKLALAARHEGYDTEIVIVNAASGQATVLTQNDTGDRSPVFSPDGDRVAYVGALGIAVVDLADGHTQKIADVPGAYGVGFRSAVPSWSPDGTRIAFATRWLYLVDASGGEPVRLSETEVSSDDTPAWSPDGTRLAFISRYTGHQDLYVINADGSGETRFPDPRWERSPTWSPSERLAFFLGGEIHVMNSDGSDRRAIGLGPEFVAGGDGLRWSPGGEALVFHGPGSIVTSCGDSEIYTVASNGGEVKNLTRHPAVDFDARWLGDGKRIAFQADSRSIYVMDRDGANPMRVWPDRSLSRADPEFPRSPWPLPPPPPPPPPPPLPPPPPDPERASGCAVSWLRFRAATYYRRDLRGLRPAALLGAGTYFSCRTQPAKRIDVRVRRILGVSPRRAVAVSRTIYVSATCARKERRVLRCLGARRQR